MIILGTNSIKDTGYDVANSCRFDNNAYMQSGNTNSTNNPWTFSVWIKRAKVGAEQTLIMSYTDSNDFGLIRFGSDDTLLIGDYVNGSYVMKYETNRKFRDVSAWYHIVVSQSAVSGASPATLLYVNGVQETSFGTSNAYSQNDTQNWQKNGENFNFMMGQGEHYQQAYVCEAVWIDNTVYAASDFGEFDEDSGIWKPKDPSGLNFGTNGFYFDFADSGNLGDNEAGNSRADFSENNIAATDQSTDTCTNNFCTMNPLDNFYSGATFSEGNIKVSSARYAGVTSTFALTKGKWYFEYKCVSRSGTSGFVGITSATATATNYEFGNQSGENVGYSVSLHNGSVYGNGGQVAAAGTFETIEGGDFGMVALDFDNNKIYYGKDGTWGNSQNPENGTNALSIVAVTQGASGHWRIYVGGETNNATVFEMNFGSPPYAISSGNTDGNGYGNFEYAVPSGYYALNTKNLAEYG